MADVLVGPYRLIEPLHNGPGGETHLAWDTALNRRVDLCFLPRLEGAALANPDVRAAFQLEMRRLSGLRHPGLLTPAGHASPGSERLWFVTEHAEALDLRAMLQLLDRLHWRQATMVLHEVAAALAFAHRHEVFHGGLSPEVAHLERTGRILLGGLEVTARVLLTAGDELRAIDRLVDHPAYLAPETLATHAQTPAADMFAFGALAFEALTGQPPFASAAAIRAYEQAQAQPPDPASWVPDLPLALRELVREMLSWQPEHRPAGAELVRDRLQRMLREAGVTNVRGGLREDLERQSRVYRGTALESRSESKVAASATLEPVRRTGEAGRRPARTQRDHTDDLASWSAGARPREVRRPTRRHEPAESAPAGPPGARSGAHRHREGQARKGLPLMQPTVAVRPEALLAELEVQAGARKRRRRERSPARAAGWLLAAIVVIAVPLLYLNRSSPGDTAAAVALRGGARPRDVVTARPGGATGAADGVEARSRPRSRGAALRGERPPPLIAGDLSATEMALTRVRSLLARGNYALAAKVARDELAGLRAGDPELQYALGQALVALGEVDEAVAVLVAADGPVSNVSRGHLQAAEALARDGRCEAAIPLFAEAARRDADQATVAKLLGNCELVVGRTDDAVRTLERAYLLAPSDRDVVGPLARAHERLGHARRARELYSEADALARRDGDRDDAAALGELRLAAAAGETASVTEAELAGATDPVALGTRGDAAFKAGRFAEAAELFAAAISATEGDPTPRLLRNSALALDRAGRAEEAVSAYRAATAAAPGDPELALLHGRVLARTGRTAAATRELERAVGVAPNLWEALFELGVLNLEGGRAKAALAAFARVLRARPGHAPSLQNVAKAQLELGREQEALETFRALAAAAPADPAPMLSVAALLQRLGRDREVTTALAEACRRGAAEACEP